MFWKVLSVQHNIPLYIGKVHMTPFGMFSNQDTEISSHQYLGSVDTCDIIRPGPNLSCNISK